ncbi:epoxide hydrolase family protein [Jatrophihabitans fulvus]
MKQEPFEVAVPDADLADLRRRLRATRWPDQLPGDDLSGGPDVDRLRALCDYWADGYDWRAAEAQLNHWPQYVTHIDGQRLHYLHVRSPEPGALPLLLTHGWPGSTFEFSKVIGPLVDPRRHGGDPADAFHVVCPSLPGYGWSGPTTEPGWDIVRVARAEASLMAGLGYGRYVAQGGDWGGIAATHLALLDREHVAAIHLNQVLAPPPRDVDPDNERVRAAERFRRDGSGYLAIQSTRPQTLAFGLTDSPAGLAAWLVEKFRDWSDCDGDLDKVFDRDELLTAVSIYWLSGTVASSARLYAESRRTRTLGRPPSEFVATPTACAIFPKDIAVPERSWAERHYAVSRWTEMPRGGHFAAFEQPNLLVDDVRTSFASVRG